MWFKAGCIREVTPYHLFVHITYLQSEYTFETVEDTNLTDCDVSIEWTVKATDADATAVNQEIEYLIVGTETLVFFQELFRIVMRPPCPGLLALV